jgi:uncharacterized protein (DUF362 family)
MPAHFVIPDGIVAMEGSGPLHGTARDLGRIVISDDPVATNFTCVAVAPEATFVAVSRNGDAAFVGCHEESSQVLRPNGGRVSLR